EPIFKQHSYAIAPTPIIKDNWVYITSGYGGGCHLFDITGSGDKLAVKDLYSRAKQKAVKNTHGGVVLLGDYIYGHSEPGVWVCQELKSGDLKWAERNELTCKSGSITAADGRLYLYTDDGEVGLLVSNPKEWQHVGGFTVPEKSTLRANRPTLRDAAVWTHP